MLTSTERADYYQHRLVALYQHCCVQLPFCNEKASDVDLEFLTSLKRLSDTHYLDEDYSFLGQSLITRIISHYPHITQAIHRDLLWHFGGDCLHYMSDEEINCYQQLDELLFQAHEQGETLDYATAKSQIFKLH